MKKEKEMIERNIELSAEFSRYLFEHPEIASEIPSEAELILLPAFDKELREYNFKLGKDMVSRGEKVCYVQIKNLRPKMWSRLEDVELVSV